jgi:hypothetical protein
MAREFVRVLDEQVAQSRQDADSVLQRHGGPGSRLQGAMSGCDRTVDIFS